MGIKLKGDAVALKVGGHTMELQLQNLPESGLMTNNHEASDKESARLEKILPEFPEDGRVFASPLGWSIKVRLLFAAAAATLLWLAVAWACGWLG